MVEDFQLVSPGPDADSLARTEKLITKLKQLAASKRARRPMLTAWSLRLEPGLHRDLKRLAERLEPDLSMTDVVHGLLEVMVPLMLAGRELKPAPQPQIDFSAMSPEVKQFIGALSQLVQQQSKG